MAERDGPGVGFGLTIIASAVILFLSVARPESQVYARSTGLAPPDNRAIL